MTLALSQEQVDVDFAEICRHERLGLVRYATSILSDRHDAEDAVQEAFLRLLETIGRRGVIQNPGALLTVMTRYEALTIRHNRYYGPILSDCLEEVVEDGGYEPEDNADVHCMADEETAAAVDAALATLPPRRRLAIEMWCLRGQTIADVAAHLRVTRGTVNDLIYPTLMAIRQGKPTAERESVANHQAEMRTLLAHRGPVDALTPVYRQAVILRYVEGLATQAIADRLGIAMDLVKSRLRNARRELRALAAGAAPTHDGAMAKAVRDGRLDHLPPRALRVAQMRYLDCLQQQQVADLLGVSHVTVVRDSRIVNAAFLALKAAEGGEPR